MAAAFDRGPALRLLFDLAPAAVLASLAAGVYFFGAWALDRTFAAEMQQQALFEEKRSCVADLTRALADPDFADFTRGLHGGEELPKRVQELAKRVTVDGFLPPFEVKLSPPKRHGEETRASLLELQAGLRHEGHFPAFVENVAAWGAGAYWLEDCALKPASGQNFSVLVRCRLRLLSRSP